jgi:hypothetical protein
MIRISWSGWERSRFFTYVAPSPIEGALTNRAAQLWVFDDFGI